MDIAGTLADTSATVLIVGERGAGKSLLAQLLGGTITDRPFVTLNAEQLGETTTNIEDSDSEASGYDQATAMTDWAAKLGQARGGTLYIAEVGALSPEFQLQLLRELQLQDMEAAAGHDRSQQRNTVRFVFSTSENLPASVEQGRFRPELYHRLSAFSLLIPPLRHRGTDIELLAEHFRIQFAREFRKDVVGLTRDAIEALQRHDWPGNVRELKGVIQRQWPAASVRGSPPASSLPSSIFSGSRDPRRRTRCGRIRRLAYVRSRRPSRNPKSGSSSRPFKPSTGTARRLPEFSISTGPRSTKK